MLHITIPPREIWNEVTQEFETIGKTELALEHSLVSIAKWESKWHKSYLSSKDKTNDQILDYVRCMTLTQNVDPNVYKFLSKDNIKQIGEYINDPMTATTFSEKPGSSRSKQIMTAELIYYNMIALNIPFECQKWHINRLLTLIRVCNEKNAPQKKMSRNELLTRNRMLNEQRRRQLGTSG